MINNDRRNFLYKTTMLAASGALTACGGGSSPSSSPSALNAAAPSDEAAVTLASVVTGTPIPNARFTLSGTSTVRSAPFCLGYAFRRGDVPAGRTVTGNTGTLQVTPKNLWPDGSLKFAVLSGTVSLVAGTDTVVELQQIPVQSAAPTLTTAKLRASGIVAEIGCGSFGTVTWSGADWDAPFQTWVDGALMSSWIYRKAVGADKHLVAWLEVRLWSSGAVEVLPWIENGFLLVPGPVNKSATYTFKLGNTQRVSVAIDLKHHQRTPLINGAELSYWLAPDPGVTPRHDPAYLQSTELVPSYSAVVPTGAASIKALPATFAPLQIGSFLYDGDNMPGTGYQEPIGLLPQHDVLYLTCAAPSIYAAVVRNGFSAGRYGIHYRDENTNRPLRFSSYPTLNIRSDGEGFKDTGGSSVGAYTPASTGGRPPAWDVAHSPSVGYMAYLLTGRWYFMEEVQFAATTNYLGNGDNPALRNGSQGLMQPCVDAWQTRSCAWGMRTLVQALSCTPDSDAALRTEFTNSVKANIDHFYGRYVAQPNNPFGFIMSGTSAYNGTISTLAPWQQDFFTATMGYALAMNLPLPDGYSAKLSAFFAWTAKSVIGRLSAPGAGFPYMNADVYVLSISAAAAPDFAGGTGPWRASWAEVYAAQAATLASSSSSSGWLTTNSTLLAGEIMPGDRALWGNLTPALAYAVRHGVTGAQAAYDRVRGASNYASLSSAFNTNPVWGVKPYGVVQTAPVVVAPVAPPTVGTPAWLAGRGIGEWIEIPGTAGAGGASVDAYSGFAFNHATNEIMIAAAGGHMDSADNRVVSLRLGDNAPVWQVRCAPSSVVKPDVAYYDDGKPSARHLYSTLHFVPQVNRLMLFGERFAYGSAYTFQTISAFNPDTNTWDPAGTWADSTSGYGAVVLRNTGEVWSSNLGRWSPVTKAWTQPITQRTNTLVRWPIAHDSMRNQLFTLMWADGEGYGTEAVFASRIPVEGAIQETITFKTGTALDSFTLEKPTYAAMDYDNDNDRFLFYCGQGAAAGKIYAVTPNAGNVWEMSVLPLTSSARPPATPDSGVHNRFRYVPALRGFVLMPSAKSNLFFIRTA